MYFFSLGNSQYKNNKVWQLIPQTFFLRVKVTYVTIIKVTHLCSKLHILRSIQQIYTTKALYTIYNGTHKSLAQRSVTSSSQLTNFFPRKRMTKNKIVTPTFMGYTDPTTL